MRLADKHICTACGACVNICPKNALSMIPDKYGFLFPSLIGNCINCNKCEKVCPVISKQNVCKSTTAYAAYSNNQQMREKSSSGGLFFHFAKEVLSSNGVVYGAAYESDFSVKHMCAENNSQLFMLCGTKYVQSKIDLCYREVKQKLESGKKTLFSGTPCQIAGLSAFLGKTYDNLILIDLVCHSVPSPLAWEKYVEYRSIQENHGISPLTINQRSKETGWSLYKYSCKFTYKSGKQTLIHNEDDIYMQLFLNGCINRESCSNCLFKGYNKISDITLGDFWGIWSIHPEMDDNKGTSLVFIHSQKGKRLLEKISNELTIKETKLEESSFENQSIISSSFVNPNRKKYIKAACKGKYSHLLKAINKKPSFFNRLKRKIISIAKQ